MKRWWFAIAAVLAAWTMLPIAKPGEAGAYNLISGLAYCANRAACEHEIGHALDQQSGWISQTPQFAEAVQLYLLVELRKETLQPLPVNVLKVASRGWREVYAYLFQQSGGDPKRMPPGLRAFFDWVRAAEYIEQLDANKTFYFLK